MINRTFELLKNNTILVILYLSLAVLNLAVVTVVYPKVLPQVNSEEANSQVITIMCISIAMGLIGLLFFTGFGKMLSEAVETGTTSMQTFLEGLKNYLGKTILMGLVIVALYVVFLVIFGVVFGIVSFFIIGLNPGVEGISSISAVALIASIITGILGILTAPFIVLSLPVLFMEGLGIFKTLKEAAIAGAKNYWKLVLSLVVMYTPALIILIMNNVQNYESIVKFAPENIGFALINSLVSLFILTIIFTIYKDWRDSNRKVESEPLIQAGDYHIIDKM